MHYSKLMSWTSLSMQPLALVHNWQQKSTATIKKT